ncbi:hypothetical protein V8C44DRAFT_353461 [Trichoderma aethiopicum]
MDATSSHYKIPYKTKIITISSASIPLSGHMRGMGPRIERRRIGFRRCDQKGIPASRGDGRGQHVGRDLKGASVLINDKVPMTRN